MTEENPENNTPKPTEIDWTNEETRQAQIAALIEKEVKGLKDKNGELLNKLKKINVAPVQEIDAAEFEALKKEKEERERLEAERRGEYQKLLSKKDREIEETVKARGERERVLRSALEGHLIDSAVTGALAAEDGNVLLLSPHVKARTRVEEVDGRFVVQVLDDDGTPSKLSVLELVKKMKGEEAFYSAFKSPMKNGGGAQPGAQNINTSENPYLMGKTTWSPTQQAKMERENPNLAARFRKEANLPF